MPATIPVFRIESASKNNTSNLSAESILGALPAATLVVDEAHAVRYANGAAEQLFQSSAPMMVGEPLADLLPPHAPLMALVEQAAAADTPMSAYGVVLDTPKTGIRTMSVHVAPMIDTPGWVVISLQEQTRALKIGQQL